MLTCFELLQQRDMWIARKEMQKPICIARVFDFAADAKLILLEFFHFDQRLNARLEFQNEGPVDRCLQKH